MRLFWWRKPKPPPAELCPICGFRSDLMSESTHSYIHRKKEEEKAKIVAAEVKPGSAGALSDPLQYRIYPASDLVVDRGEIDRFQEFNLRLRSSMRCRVCGDLGLFCSKVYLMKYRVDGSVMMQAIGHGQDEIRYLSFEQLSGQSIPWMEFFTAPGEKQGESA